MRFSLLLIICLHIKLTAQVSFRAFSNNPTKPNDSLFININTSRTDNEKTKHTLILIEFHEKVGNLDSIIHYSKKITQNTFCSKEALAMATYQRAKANFNKGLYDKALQLYFQGSELAKDLKSKKILLKNQLGLGFCKVIRGKTTEGNAIIDSCINQTIDSQTQHDAYYYKAQVLFVQGKLNNAKELFERCFKFYKQNKKIKEQLKVALALAKIKDIQNKKVLENYFTIFNKAYSHQFFDIYIDCANAIGQFYAKEQDYDNARKILHSAYTNAIEWNNLEAQKAVLKNLELVFNKSGDYKNAYAIMTQLRNVERSILTKQNISEINELEIKYDILEKEQEISLQKKQKQNILIGFIIVLAPLIALFYTYYQKLQAQSKLSETQKKMNEQRVKTILQKQELELIKASIAGEEKERKRIAQELHDSIGGNLATIKLQLSSKTQSTLIKQVDETYQQVRNLSHNLTPKKFQEKTFSLLIAHYIEKATSQTKEKISLHIYPEHEVNQLNENIKIQLYKIIQELITNTFKHAKADEINIHLSVLDSEIQLIVEDNGIGFDPTTQKEGIGFQNIRERLQSINGNLLVDTHKNRGTIININVPLI